MAPYSSKTLKIIEKFRAPAALWRPSLHAGDGWVETSGIRRGGQIIIQTQENADDNEGPVAVVRFVLRHGQDVMNARILNGLPIHRCEENEILFKSASTSTYRVRWKTTFRIKFTTPDDTDDFLMWWYAKNGSIKAWSEASSLRFKRKSTEQIGGMERKRPKIASSENNALTQTDKAANGKLKLSHQVLVESTNVKHGAIGSKNNDKRNSFVCGKSKENDSSNVNNESKENSNSNLTDNNEMREVMIDYDEVPQSQNWFASFEEYK